MVIWQGHRSWCSTPKNTSSQMFQIHFFETKRRKEELKQPNFKFLMRMLWNITTHSFHYSAWIPFILCAFLCESKLCWPQSYAGCIFCESKIFSDSQHIWQFSATFIEFSMLLSVKLKYVEPLCELKIVHWSKMYTMTLIHVWMGLRVHWISHVKISCGMMMNMG